MVYAGEVDSSGSIMLRQSNFGSDAFQNESIRQGIIS